MSERTTVAISTETRRFLGLLCGIKGLTQGQVLDALVRAEALNHDPEADYAKTVLVDFEARTTRTETVGGKVWTVPLSRRSWEVFKDYEWKRAADFCFEEEKGEL